MPLVQTRGAASAQGFGEFAQATAVNYIEDVFSTYLYTGNGSTQTITNGIDLSGKGGLVWIKSRTTAFYHNLFDTVRGVNNRIFTPVSDAQITTADSLTAFNSNGFSVGVAGGLNVSTDLNVSWTFRKQPKFFDVVTYTGTGSNTTIAHSLGSVPGSIIVKRTDTTAAWAVYHRSLANTQYLVLNDTAAAATGATWWNSTTPTSAVFSLGTDASVNASGGTYVAYVFAHDAGGFGLTGTDNVVSCGSYVGNASTTGPVITLGYEPQWVLLKSSTSGGTYWYIVDTMRGMAVTGVTASLTPNSSNAENGYSNMPILAPNATGFQLIQSDGDFNGSGQTYIYIAIRRGPMKVPTSGTSVFSPTIRTGTGSAATITGVGFPVDLVIDKPRNFADTGSFEDRLRGSTQNLVPSSTSAESTSLSTWDVTSFASMDGISVGISGNVNINTSGTTTVNWFFRRAPSFFDEVCYTGTGVANTAFTHNLTVTPELMIVKPRSAATAPNWRVWSPINSTDFNLLQLSTDGAASSSLYSSSNVFPAIPTSTTFTVGGSGSIQLNQSGQTFVAYLFATCAGVSKVGSYTGTATTKQIDCGFTGGARFVLIKRTDSTGDWYVWDSARGIVAGNDPYLLLNSTAAEVTSTDYVDTYSAGFEISSTAPAAINANGGNFIFLAIA